jgi:uncharacterized protein (TIGR00251 family)
MKISVKVKPRAREEKIEKLSDTEFIVSVKTLPEKGAANEAVINLLADYFRISRSRVAIVRGATSRKKIIEIK